jgi:hypothetical protein
MRCSPISSGKAGVRRKPDNERGGWRSAIVYLCDRSDHECWHDREGHGLESRKTGRALLAMLIPASRSEPPLGLAGDTAREVASGASTNLQTNKAPVNERLNGWPGDGGYEHDTSDLTKYQDPAWPFDMIADGVSRAQATERT